MFDNYRVSGAHTSSPDRFCWLAADTADEPDAQSSTGVSTTFDN